MLNTTLECHVAGSYAFSHEVFAFIYINKYNTYIVIPHIILFEVIIILLFKKKKKKKKKKIIVGP